MKGINPLPMLPSSRVGGKACVVYTVAIQSRSPSSASSTCLKALEL